MRRSHFVILIVGFVFAVSQMSLSLAFALETPEKMNENMDNAVAKLTLSSDQSQLWKKLQVARSAHHKCMMAVLEGKSFREKLGSFKEVKAVKGAFDNEMKKDNPDFAAVSAKMKSSFQEGPCRETFNKFLDAQAAFFTKLTADQRKSLVGFLG
jgi:hypothetical protein